MIILKYITLILLITISFIPAVIGFIYQFLTLGFNLGKHIADNMFNAITIWMEN